MNFGKIAFLGCGNMGRALATAVSKKTKNIIVSSHGSSTADAFAERLSVSSGSNAKAVEEADLIFIGVKPQVISELASEISPLLKAKSEAGSRFVLVSMATGISMESILEILGADYPIIRIMPNTPASIGAGMILYCSRGVSDEEEAAFFNIMENAGTFDKIPEQLIDAGSAVSGCGPAFVCKFIEAMADGGVACGLPRKKAQMYAAETLIGTAKLVLESGEHPAALKDAVCSPGGTAIQGIRALDKGGFSSAVIEAVVAAFEKNSRLSK